MKRIALLIFLAALAVVLIEPARPFVSGTLPRKEIRSSVGVPRSVIVFTAKQRGLRVELALAARAYGAHYWDSEVSGIGKKQLDDEINTALLRLGGAQGGPVLRVFGRENPAPFLGFLPEGLRKTMIGEMENGCTDAQALCAKAHQDLPPDLAALYDKWNAPASTLLRNQLIGFSATQAEFDAVSLWPNFVNQNQAGIAGDATAEAGLAQLIGVDRTAQLMELRDPDMQTVVQDLDRLGLPLGRAYVVADMRSQGIAAIQAVQARAGLSQADKDLEVLRLRRSFSDQIAASLHAGPGLTEDDLMP